MYSYKGDYVVNTIFISCAKNVSKYSFRKIFCIMILKEGICIFGHLQKYYLWHCFSMEVRINIRKFKRYRTIIAWLLSCAIGGVLDIASIGNTLDIKVMCISISKCAKEMHGEKKNVQGILGQSLLFIPYKNEIQPILWKITKSNEFHILLTGS